MKISLVILAAGSGKRFGSNKLLFEINNKPLYQHTIDMIKQAERLNESLFFEKIIVTSHKEIQENSNLIKHYSIVMNPNSEEGISTSIQAGIRASHKNTDAWCFLVCDQPYLTPKTVYGLIEGWKKSKLNMGCVVQEEQLGNPTIFKKKYKKDLMELKGDIGGKKIIRAHLEEVFCYRISSKTELKDIDEMKDCKAY